MLCLVFASPVLHRVYYILLCSCESKVEATFAEAGAGDEDKDEDDDIERRVLLRPYEHDKRMLARMRQAGGTSKVQ